MKPTFSASFRLEQVDIDLFEEIARHLEEVQGKATRSDVLRFALRLAAKECQKKSRKDRPCHAK